MSLITLCAGLGAVVCAAGVAYPFWPFQTRWRALVAGLVLLGAVGAPLLPPVQSGEQPARAGTFTPCADQKACDEANKAAYSSPQHKTLSAIQSVDRPAEHIKLNEFTWTRAGFGVVLVASFKLANPLVFAVKDIGIECTVAGASGTPLGSVSKILYQRLPAKSSKQFKDFNVGIINSQAERASCRVVSVVPSID